MFETLRYKGHHIQTAEHASDGTKYHATLDLDDGRTVAVPAKSLFGAKVIITSFLQSLKDPVLESYFVLDDTMENGKEGWVVMEGNPLTACGFQRGEFSTLGAALDFANAEATEMARRTYLPAPKPVYRVRLARRHYVHTVHSIDKD